MYTTDLIRGNSITVNVENPFGDPFGWSNIYTDEIRKFRLRSDTVRDVFIGSDQEKCHSENIIELTYQKGENKSELYKRLREETDKKIWEYIRSLNLPYEPGEDEELDNFLNSFTE